MYSNRNYVIFNVSEIDKVDFTQVLETSPETLRRSVDETKTFVKWDMVPSNTESVVPATDPAAAAGEVETIPVEPGYPSFIGDLTTAEGPYTHEEILTILSGPEWTPQLPEA